MYFEETNELKFQIFRLEEQVKMLQRKNSSEESLTQEKLSAFEGHIRMLQEENIKLAEGSKIKREQISQTVLKQMAEKDGLILELTRKLKASTLAIKEIKSKQVTSFTQ